MKEDTPGAVWLSMEDERENLLTEIDQIGSRTP